MFLTISQIHREPPESKSLSWRNCRLQLGIWRESFEFWENSRTTFSIELLQWLLLKMSQSIEMARAVAWNGLHLQSVILQSNSIAFNLNAPKWNSKVIMIIFYELGFVSRDSFDHVLIVLDYHIPRHNCLVIYGCFCNRSLHWIPCV